MNRDDTALAQALKTYRIVWPAIVLYIALMMFIELLVIWTGSNGVRNVAAVIGPAFVAYAAHNVVLRGGAIRGAMIFEHPDPRSLGRFFMRAFLISFLILPFVILGVFAGPVGSDDTVLLAAILRALVAGAIGAWLVFSLCGTIFPAVMDGADASLGAALGRGSFGALWWRLIVGPGAVFGAVTALGLWLGLNHPGTMVPFSDQGTFSALWVPASILLYAIAAFGTVLLAVMLSRYWLAWKAAGGGAA